MLAVPSHNMIASPVDLVTPPNVPRVGDGLTYAFGALKLIEEFKGCQTDRERSSIRVLSPNIEPPVRVEDGSTA
jgi:hypothetical protein